MSARKIVLAASALLLTSSIAFAQNIVAPPSQPQSGSQAQSMQPFAPGNTSNNNAASGNAINTSAPQSSGTNASGANVIARPRIDPQTRAAIRACIQQQGVEWPPMGQSGGQSREGQMQPDSQSQAMQPSPGNGPGNQQGAQPKDMMAHPRLTPEQREIVKRCFEQNGVQWPPLGQSGGQSGSQPGGPGHMQPMGNQQGGNQGGQNGGLGGGQNGIPLPGANTMPAPAPNAPPTGMPGDTK